MGSSNEFKIFWDAVHGQIKISNILCKHILDTEYFQRLKRLEQTNARPLYPCAHHDRFIHSIGTYHLGKMAFKAIEKNSNSYIKEYAKSKTRSNQINWATLGHEFSLACLLHDVGHAPFSHTFERFYNVDLDSRNNNILDDFLLNKSPLHQIPNVKKKYSSSFDSFVRDYDLARLGQTFTNESGKAFKLGSNPKEHEKVSAFMVLTKFQDAIKNVSSDSNPFNIARMILGIKFSDGFETDNTENIKYQIYNCFIELLNGEEIDADKIDYLIRDQWATGNVFRRIDYTRLLNSIYIRQEAESGILQNFFHKKSINEIIAIKETKHNISVNVHSHPVVKYDDHILKKAVNEVVKLEMDLFMKSNSIEVDPEKKENFVSKIVSVDALMNPVDYLNSKIYLPSDDDLVHILKKNIKDSLYAKEWLSRDYRLKALWKSSFDFNFYFSELDSFGKKVLYKRIEAIADNYLKQCHKLKENSTLDKLFYIQKDGLKGYQIFQFDSNLNILIEEKPLETKKLFTLLNGDRAGSADKNPETPDYFILYLPTPFVNKNIDPKRVEERLGFIHYAIDDVKTYIVDFEKNIIRILNEKSNLNYIEISQLLPFYDSVASSDELKNEFQDNVGLFLAHLLEKGEIDGDSESKNPKKRKFFIKQALNAS